MGRFSPGVPVIPTEIPVIPGLRRAYLAELCTDSGAEYSVIPALAAGMTLYSGRFGRREQGLVRLS